MREFSRSNYSGNNQGNYFHGNYQGSRGNFQYSSSHTDSKVPCQICGSTGHEAIDCFDRMNPEIVGRVPPAKLAAFSAHYSSKSNPSWLIDSGAISHITNDIANISAPSLYTGEDKVYIGDGKGLSISHVGHSSLNTHHSSFKLSNVLHVPHMTHNLLSAYQFLKDNNCALTLDLDGSTVKDRISGRCFCRVRLRMTYILFKHPTSILLLPSLAPKTGTSPFINFSKNLV